VSFAEPLPLIIPPMLLRSGEPPAGDEWTYEIKWDGIRAQVRYDGRTACLRSRPGRLCDALPEVEGIADALGHHRATLDGEIVVLRDDGRPDFALLRQRLGRRASNPHPVTFAIFDVLHLDGCSTRDLPYRERRADPRRASFGGPLLANPGLATSR
jgi:bifunctional non-homologous end joining protein LigD